MSTLYGKLLILSSTIHMTKSRISVLHGVFIVPTVEQCNPHLTAHEMPIRTTHPVCLWSADEQEAKFDDKNAANDGGQNIPPKHQN